MDCENVGWTLTEEEARLILRAFGTDTVLFETFGESTMVEEARDFPNRIAYLRFLLSIERQALDEAGVPYREQAGVVAVIRDRLHQAGFAV